MERVFLTRKTLAKNSVASNIQDGLLDYYVLFSRFSRLAETPREYVIGPSKR